MKNYGQLLYKKKKRTPKNPTYGCPLLRASLRVSCCPSLRCVVVTGSIDPEYEEVTVNYFIKWIKEHRKNPPMGVPFYP
jgi:hypothetical protein